MVQPSLMNMHLMHHTKIFHADETGSAAVEFAILSPLFLIILAGIANIGLAINWKIAAENRISAVSNQAIIEKPNLTDENAAIDYFNEIKDFVSNSPIQEYSQDNEKFILNLNNFYEITITAGEATSKALDKPLSDCYCPNKSNGIIIWGNSFNCSETCADGQTAARYLIVTAENNSLLNIISGYAFSPADVKFTTAIRLE